MSIVLEDLLKRYEGHIVVNHVSLEIANGEFFVLLGSSGSGKTTILNIIAGLTEAEQGRVLLHDREVTGLPPQERRVGFVFQNYALFQHMTVAENIDFGPSIHKIPKKERIRRRDALLDLVGLTGLGDRMPRQLSGGQQQRVALARALVLAPDVLLLDEPLGALDAKIRLELRRSLKAVQQRLGITTILVTHDQEEAFDLADRIGVMSYGRLLEVGTPQSLYQSPKTEFVASFLGSSNLLVGDFTHGAIQLGSQQFPVPVEQSHALANERRIQVLFRPEDVALGPSAQELNCLAIGAGRVETVSFGGPVERLRLRLPPMAGIRPISPPVPFGTKSILVEATRSPDEAVQMSLQPGDTVWIGVRRIHALTNPGISVLIVSDCSPSTQYAIDLGGFIARLAHARVTLLHCESKEPATPAELQSFRKQLTGGPSALEVISSQDKAETAIANIVEQRPSDVIVLGFDVNEHLQRVEQILQHGEQHLLLAPAPSLKPSRVLICVAGGEPGKEDVLFAGRLTHHLGADATLMTVLPEAARADEERKARAEQYLERGLDSLALLGVKASQVVRIGDVAGQILQEMSEGGHDMLVIGVPLAKTAGQIELKGVVHDLLSAVTNAPVLLIRSNYAGSRKIPSSARW